MTSAIIIHCMGLSPRMLYDIGSESKFSVRSILMSLLYLDPGVLYDTGLAKPVTSRLPCFGFIQSYLHEPTRPTHQYTASSPLTQSYRNTTLTITEQLAFNHCSARSVLWDASANMNSPAHTSPTLSKHQSTKTPAREQKLKSSAASATPFKPLSTPNRPSAGRPTDLPTKISQLKVTIEHTLQQLIETLDKLAALPDPASGHPPSPITPPSVKHATSFAAISTTPGLPPTQRTTLANAQPVLDRHIKLLGQYNELKDAGMMMMGLIAEREGRVMRDVMEERGIGEDD